MIDTSTPCFIDPQTHRLSQAPSVTDILTLTHAVFDNEETTLFDMGQRRYTPEKNRDQYQDGKL